MGACTMRQWRRVFGACLHTVQSTGSHWALIMPFIAQTLQRTKQASYSSTSQYVWTPNFWTMGMSAAYGLLWRCSWLTTKDRKEDNGSRILWSIPKCCSNPDWKIGGSALKDVLEKESLWSICLSLQKKFRVTYFWEKPVSINVLWDLQQTSQFFATLDAGIDMEVLAHQL